MKKVSNGSFFKVILSVVIGLLLFMMILAGVSQTIVGNVAEDPVYADTLSNTVGKIKLGVCEGSKPILHKSTENGTLLATSYNADDPYAIDLTSATAESDWENLKKNFTLDLTYKSTSEIFSMQQMGFANLFPGSVLDPDVYNTSTKKYGLNYEKRDAVKSIIQDSKITLRSDNGPMNDGVHYVNAGTTLADTSAAELDYIFFCETCKQEINLIKSDDAKNPGTDNEEHYYTYNINFHTKCTDCDGTLSTQYTKIDPNDDLYYCRLTCTSCHYVFGYPEGGLCSVCGGNLSGNSERYYCNNSGCPANNSKLGSTYKVVNYYEKSYSTHTTASNQTHTITTIPAVVDCSTEDANTKYSIPVEKILPVIEDGDSESLKTAKKDVLLEEIDNFRLAVDKIYISGTNWKGETVTNQLIFQSSLSEPWSYPIAGVYHISKLHFKCEASIPYYTSCQYYAGEFFVSSKLTMGSANEHPTGMLAKTLSGKTTSDFSFTIEFNSLTEQDYPIVCSSKIEIKANSDINGRIINNLVKGGTAEYDGVTNWKSRISLYSSSSMGVENNGYFSYSYSGVQPFKFYKGVLNNTETDGTDLSAVKDCLSIYWYSDPLLSEQVKDPETGGIQNNIVDAGNYYLSIFPKNTENLKSGGVDYSRRVLYFTFGLDDYVVPMPSIFDDGITTDRVNVYRQPFIVVRKPLRIVITDDPETSMGVTLSESSKEYAPLYEKVDMTEFTEGQDLTINGELAEGVSKMYYNSQDTTDIATKYYKNKVYYTYNDITGTFFQVELSGIEKGGTLPGQDNDVNPQGHKYFTFDENTGRYSPCSTMPNYGVVLYYLDTETMASASGFFTEIIDHWESIGGLTSDKPIATGEDAIASALSFRGSIFWDENKEISYDIGSYDTIKLTMSFSTDILDQNYSIVIGTYDQNEFTPFPYYGGAVTKSSETGRYEYCFDFTNPKVIKVDQVTGDETHEKFTIYPKPIQVEINEEAMGMKEGVFQYGEIYYSSDIDPAIFELTQYEKMEMKYDEAGDYFYYAVDGSDNCIIRIVSKPEDVKKVEGKTVVYLVASVYLKMYDGNGSFDDNEAIKNNYNSNDVSTYGYMSRNSDNAELFDYYNRYSRVLYPNESMVLTNDNNYNWNYYYLAYYVAVMKEEGGEPIIMSCFDAASAVWNVTDLAEAPEGFNDPNTTKKQKAAQSIMTFEMNTPLAFTVQKLNAYYEVYDMNVDKVYDASTTVYAAVYRKAIPGGIDYTVGATRDRDFYEKIVYNENIELGYYYTKTVDEKFLPDKDYYLLVDKPIYSPLSTALYNVDDTITTPVYELSGTGYFITADKKYKNGKVYYTKLDCYQTEREAYKELKVEYFPTYRKAINKVHYSISNKKLKYIPRYYDDAEGTIVSQDEQVSIKKTYYIRQGVNIVPVEEGEVYFFYTYNAESDIYTRVIPDADNVEFNEDVTYYLSLSPTFTVKGANNEYVKCDSVLENDLAVYFDSVVSLEYGDKTADKHEIRINPVIIDGQERYFRTLSTYVSTDGNDINAINSYERRGLRYSGMTEVSGEIHPQELQLSFLPDPFKITDTENEGYAPGADYARPYQSKTGVAIRVAKYDTVGDGTYSIQVFEDDQYVDKDIEMSIWNSFLQDYPQYKYLESEDYYTASQIEDNKKYGDLYYMYYMDENDSKYVLGYYYYGEIVENMTGKSLYEQTPLKDDSEELKAELIETVYFDIDGNNTYTPLALFDRTNLDDSGNPIEIKMSEIKFIFLDLIDGFLDNMFVTEGFDWTLNAPTYLAQNWEFDDDPDDGHVYNDFMDGEAIIDLVGRDFIYWYSDETVENSRRGVNGQNLSKNVSYGAKCLEIDDYYYLHLDFEFVLKNYVITFSAAERNGFDDNRIKFSITKAVLTSDKVGFTYREASEERKIGYNATGHKEEIVMADLNGSQYSYITFDSHPEADYYFSYKTRSDTCSTINHFATGLTIESCSEMVTKAIDGASDDPNAENTKIKIETKYDDCNPFGMIAGDFGTIDELGKHAYQDPSNESSFINLAGDKFKVFDDSTNGDYEDFCKEAISLFKNNANIEYVKNVSDSYTNSAIIGIGASNSFIYSKTGSDVRTMTYDFQNVLAKLFGFSNKSDFLGYADTLAELYKWYKAIYTSENYDCPVLNPSDCTSYQAHKKGTDPDAVSIPSELLDKLGANINYTYVWNANTMQVDSCLTVGNFRHLQDGCLFASDANRFIFPIAFKGEYKTESEEESDLMAIVGYIIIDCSGSGDAKLYIWVNNVTEVLKTINYNADYETDKGIINRIYCKNMLFSSDTKGITIKVDYCDCNLPSYMLAFSDGKVNKNMHTFKTGKVPNITVDSFRILSGYYEQMVGSYSASNVNSMPDYLQFVNAAKNTYKKSEKIEAYVDGIFATDGGAVIGINKKFMIRPSSYMSSHEDALQVLAMIFGYEDDAQKLKNNINSLANDFKLFLDNSEIKDEILHYNGGIYIREKDILVFPYILETNITDFERIALMLFIDKNGNSAVWISELNAVAETMTTAIEEGWSFTFVGRCSLFETTAGTFEGENYLDTKTLSYEELLTYTEYQLRGWMIDSYTMVSKEHEGDSIKSLFIDGEMTVEFEEVVLSKDGESITLSFAEVIDRYWKDNLTGWLIVEFHIYVQEKQGDMILNYFKDENGGYKFDPSCLQLNFVNITLQKGNYNKNDDFIEIVSFTYVDANGEEMTIAGNITNADILNFKLAGTYMIKITIPASTNYRSIPCDNPAEDSNGYWKFVVSPAPLYVYPTVASRKFMATYDIEKEIVYRNTQENRHIVLAESEEDLATYEGYINSLNGDIYKDKSSIPEGVTSYYKVYIYHNPYIIATGSVFDSTRTYYVCQEGIYLKTSNVVFDVENIITNDVYIKSDNKEDWVYDLDQIYVIYYGLYPTNGIAGAPLETFSSSDKYAAVVNNVANNDKFMEKDSDNRFIDKAQIYGKDKTYSEMQMINGIETQVFTLPIEASNAYKQNYSFVYPEEKSPSSYFYVWKQQLTILRDYHQELVYTGQYVQPIHRVIDEENASITDVNLNMYYGAYYYLDETDQIRLIANLSNGQNIVGTKDGKFVSAPSDLTDIAEYCAYYYFIDNNGIKTIIFTNSSNGKAVSHYYYDENKYSDNNKRHDISEPITLDPQYEKTCITVIDGKIIDIDFIDNSTVSFSELQNIKDVYIESNSKKRGGYIVKMIAKDTTGNYYDSDQMTVLFDIIPLSITTDPNSIYQEKMFDRNPYGLPTDDGMDFQNVFIRDNVVCNERNIVDLVDAHIYVEYCDCDAILTVHTAGSTALCRHKKDAVIDNATAINFDAISNYFSLFYDSVDNWEQWKLIQEVAENDPYDIFLNSVSSLYLSASLRQYFNNKTKFELTDTAVISVNNESVIVFKDQIYTYNTFINAIARLFGFDDSDIFVQKVEELATAYMANSAGASASTLANRLIYDGAVFTKNESFILPYFFMDSLSDIDTFALIVIIDKFGQVSFWVDNIEASLSAANVADVQYAIGNRPLVSAYGRCVMTSNAVSSNWGDVSVEGYYYFSREGEEIGSMMDTTWWCFDKYTTTLESDHLEVGYCDCNVFGTAQRNGVSTYSLSRHPNASIPEETTALFRSLFVSYLAFMADPSDANYNAFFDIANNLFNVVSESSITKGKNLASKTLGGIINITDETLYTSVTGTYGDMFFTLSRLFGYSDELLFKSYINTIVSTLDGMTDPLDGAIATDNGYVLPYAFYTKTGESTSLTVPAFVFIGNDGKVSVWLGNFETATEMVSRGTVENTSVIDVYGRCALFEIQNKAYDYEMLYLIDKMELSSPQPTEEEFNDDRDNYYQQTTDYYILSSWTKWEAGKYFDVKEVLVIDEPDDWTWKFSSYYKYENGGFVALKNFVFFEANTYYSLTVTEVVLTPSFTEDNWNTQYKNYFRAEKGYAKSHTWNENMEYYHNEHVIASEDDLHALDAQGTEYEVENYYSNDMINAGWYIVLLKATITTNSNMRNNINFSSANNVIFGAKEYKKSEYERYFIVYLSRSRFDGYTFRVDYPQSTFTKVNKEIEDVMLTLSKTYNGMVDDIACSLTLFQQTDENILPVSAVVSNNKDVTNSGDYMTRIGTFPNAPAEVVVGTVVPSAKYYEKVTIKGGKVIYIETTDRLFKSGKEYYCLDSSSFSYNMDPSVRNMMKSSPETTTENGVAYYIRFSINDGAEDAYNNNYATKSFLVAVIINKKSLSAWFETVPVPEEELPLLNEEEIEDRNGVIYYKSAKYYGETNESVENRFVLVFDKNDLLEEDKAILDQYDSSELPVIDWNGIKQDSPVGEYYIRAKKVMNATVALQNYDFKFEIPTAFTILRRTPKFDFESTRVYQGQTIQPTATRMDDKTFKDLSTVDDDVVNIRIECLGKLNDSASYWYTLTNDAVDPESGEKTRYTSVPTHGLLVSSIESSNFFDENVFTRSTVRNVGTYLFKVSFPQSRNYKGMSDTFYIFKITKANLELQFVAVNGTSIVSSRGYASKTYDGMEGNYPYFAARYVGFKGTDRNLPETTNIQKIKYYYDGMNYYDGEVDEYNGIESLGLVNPFYTFVDEENAYSEYKINGMIYKPVDVRRDSSGKIIPYHIAIKDDPTGASGIATNYTISYKYVGENLYPEMRIEPRPVYATFDDTCEKIVKTYDGTTRVTITITKNNYVFTKTRENNAEVKASGPLENDDISLIIDYNASYFARKNVFDDQFVQSDVDIQVKVSESLGGAQKGNYVLKFKNDTNYVVLKGVINQAKADVRFYEKQGDKLIEASSVINTAYNGESQPVSKRITGVAIYDGQGQYIGNESVSYSQRYYAYYPDSQDIMFESTDIAPDTSAEYVYEITILNETLEDMNYMPDVIPITYIINRTKAQIVFGGNRTVEYGNFSSGVSATAVGIGGYQKVLTVEYFTSYTPKEIFDENGVFLRYEDDVNGFSGLIEDIKRAPAGEYYARAIFQGSSDFISSFGMETFTIGKREVAVSYPKIAESYVYTGQTPQIEFYITYEEVKTSVTQKLYQVLKNGVMVPYNYTEEDGVITNIVEKYPVDVGQYQVRPYASMHNFSFSNASWIKFSITKAYIMVSVKSQTLLVGEEYIPEYEVTGTVNVPNIGTLLSGITLQYYDATTGELLAEKPMNAGIYKVKPQDIVLANYNVSVSTFGQLKINQKVLDLGDVIIESNSGFSPGTTVTPTEIENVKDTPLQQSFDSFKDKNEDLKGLYLSKTYSLTWDNFTSSVEPSENEDEAYKMTLRVPDLVKYIRSLQSGGEAENAAPKVAYAENDTFRAAIFYKSGKIIIRDVEIVDDEKISFSANSSYNDDGSSDLISAISVLTPEDLSSEKETDLGWLMYLFIGLGVAALALSIVLVLKRKG